MNIKFPIFSGPQAGTLQYAFQSISNAFGGVLSKDEGAPRVLLTDADGQVWAITVTTLGVVTTTTVSGKDRQV